MGNDFFDVLTVRYDEAAQRNIRIPDLYMTVLSALVGCANRSLLTFETLLWFCDHFLNADLRRQKQW